MKICIINNIYPPYARGGAEQVVQKTIEGLVQEGHDIILITTSPEMEQSVERHDKVTIYRFRPVNLFFYTYAHQYPWIVRLIWHIIDILNISSYVRVKDILQQEQPDVVHTHNLMGIGFLIPYLIRKMRFRHLHTVHDVQLVEPSGIILKSSEGRRDVLHWLRLAYTRIMRRLMGSPDVVISPSMFLKEFYTERGFFSDSEVMVLRNPLTFLPERGEKKEKKNNNTFQFLYVGQIEQHKGVDVLVHAFLAYIKETQQPCHLHIVGSGSQFEDIKQLVSENKEAVTLHGRVGREEISRFFQQADVTVVPSLCYENSPTVIFESFCFGTPVLASNIEGIAELIDEEKNGLTFAAGDREALQEKLAWCAMHPDDVQAMGNTTYDSIKNLTLDTYIQKLLGKYLDGGE